MTSREASTTVLIVEAMADLVLTRGVRAMTLNDARAATGTSRSHLFHDFPDGKPDLVPAVVLGGTERVLPSRRLLPKELDSFAPLQRRRGAIVAGQRQNCVGGCPMGLLASDVAEHDEQAHTLLTGWSGRWRALLSAGLRAMRDGGLLRTGADLDDLRLAIVASVQRGLLLARPTHSTSPPAVVLDAALAHLRS